MRAVRAALFVTGALVGFSTSAAAMPITLQMSASVDSDVKGGPLQLFSLGSPLLMTMTWVVHFKAQPGGVSFMMDPADGLSLLTIENGTAYDRMMGPGADNTAASSDDGLRVWLSRWELFSSADVFASTALPTVALNAVENGLAGLTMHNTAAGRDDSVGATVTRAHTVPEPSTLVLFGFGALGLARWGRRHLTRSPRMAEQRG